MSSTASTPVTQYHCANRVQAWAVEADGVTEVKVAGYKDCNTHDNNGSNGPRCNQRPARGGATSRYQTTHKSGPRKGETHDMIWAQVGPGEYSCLNCRKMHDADMRRAISS